MPEELLATFTVNRLTILDETGTVDESLMPELADSQVRCALNQELATLSSPLRDGDEVAIFSPISGG